MATKNVKAPDITSDINVTPMVDVMLVLLIIFMVITPLLAKGVTVDLVKTKNPISMKKADQDDAIVVAVQQAAGIHAIAGWTGAQHPRLQCRGRTRAVARACRHSHRHGFLAAVRCVLASGICDQCRVDGRGIRPDGPSNNPLFHTLNQGIQI